MEQEARMESRPRPYSFFGNGRPAPLPGCTPLAESPDLPPPLPSRPVEWGRAWRLLSEIRRDPEKTEMAFEMFTAVGGGGDDPLFLRFAHTREGQALLADKPCLLGVLADREALAAMPAGSFGRAYLAFAEENGFAADGLLEVRDRGFDGLDADLDPERQWFFDRLTLMHDLWHVLTGYGTDKVGEAALLAFSRGQGMRGRALTIFMVVAATFGGPSLQRFMFQAWRRSRRAAALVVQRYEELLPLPIEQVRTRLRVAPEFAAHPGGVLRWVDERMVRIAV